MLILNTSLITDAPHLPRALESMREIIVPLTRHPLVRAARMLRVAEMENTPIHDPQNISLQFEFDSESDLRRFQTEALAPALHHYRTRMGEHSLPVTTLLQPVNF